MLTLYASGVWNCGARCESHWFQLEWDSHLRDKGIAQKELIPMVVAGSRAGVAMEDISSYLILN